MYNTNSTSLAVKWSHIQKQYFQGRPVGYKIVFYPVDRGSHDFNSVNVKHSTNTTVLTGLAVGTMYAIQVSAVSSGGVGSAKKILAETSRKKFVLDLVTGLPALTSGNPYNNLSTYSGYRKNKEYKHMKIDDYFLDRQEI